MRTTMKGPRLVAVFLLGVLLFNYPLLAVFNAPASLFGVPVLYLYLFFVWALIILLLAIAMERQE